jgi:glycosyltransferase involved in cell wall biosynthesis
MKLSVCMITYNHEKFIDAAINSILEQQTDFAYELVIGEDKSSDSTREICLRYAREYPDIIRVLEFPENQGMILNFINTLNSCRGEYIAFIEGDDYWTDPQKLKKQVAFMDTHPDFSLCFHNVTKRFVWNNQDAQQPFHDTPMKEEYTTEDLLGQWFIPSCSVVFRRYDNFDFPEWFLHCKSGDIPFLLLLSLRGRIKYLDQNMGVYRIHDHGVSITHRGYFKIISMIWILENFNVYTKFRFAAKAREAMIGEINLHMPRETTTTATPADSPRISVWNRILRSTTRIKST